MYWSDFTVTFCCYCKYLDQNLIFMKGFSVRDNNTFSLTFQDRKIQGQACSFGAAYPEQESELQSHEIS